MAFDAEQWPEPLRDRAYGRGLFALAAGVFGGPVIWFADQQVAYWLVYHSCHTQSLFWLYLETVVAVVLAAACAWVAWRTLAWFPAADASGAQPDDRSHFLSLVGLGLSGLATLVIIAAALPRFILHPCP
jgi:small-conductance mechanosensitive channel